MSELVFTEWDHQISEMMQDYVIQFINDEENLISRDVIWENYSKTGLVIQFGNKIKNIKQPRQKQIKLIEENINYLLKNENAY
jgi:hypothetical protein